MLNQKSMQATKIRVTKVFTFDMAHALFGYDGPCKNIHGVKLEETPTSYAEWFREDNV